MELSEEQPATTRAKANTVSNRIGPLSLCGRLDGAVRASPLGRAYKWPSWMAQPSERTRLIPYRTLIDLCDRVAPVQYRPRLGFGTHESFASRRFGARPSFGRAR